MNLIRALSASLMLLAAAPALAAHDDVPIAHDTLEQRDNANVYLGTVDDRGVIVASHFDNVPTVRMIEHSADIDTGAITIVARQGAKVHARASSVSNVIGRLPFRASVKLLRVHVRFGFAWGEVDVGKSMLSQDRRSYAIDGFTGRSGTSPVRSRSYPVSVRVARSGLEPHRRLRV